MANGIKGHGNGKLLKLLLTPNVSVVSIRKHYVIISPTPTLTKRLANGNSLTPAARFCRRGRTSMTACARACLFRNIIDSSGVLICPCERHGKLGRWVHGQITTLYLCVSTKVRVAYSSAESYLHGRAHRWCSWYSFQCCGGMADQCFLNGSLWHKYHLHAKFACVRSMIFKVASIWKPSTYCNFTWASWRVKNLSRTLGCAPQRDLRPPLMPMEKVSSPKPIKGTLKQPWETEEWLGLTFFRQTKSRSTWTTMQISSTLLRTR